MTTYQRAVRKVYGMQDDRRIKFVTHLWGMGLIDKVQLDSILASLNQDVADAIKAKIG